MFDCFAVEFDVVRGEEIAAAAMAVVPATVLIEKVVGAAADCAEEARTAWWSVAGGICNAIDKR